MIDLEAGRSCVDDEQGVILTRSILTIQGTVTESTSVPTPSKQFIDCQLIILADPILAGDSVELPDVDQHGLVICRVSLNEVLGYCRRPFAGATRRRNSSLVGDAAREAGCSLRTYGSSHGDGYSHSETIQVVNAECPADCRFANPNIHFSGLQICAHPAAHSGCSRL